MTYKLRPFKDEVRPRVDEAGFFVFLTLLACLAGGTARGRELAYRRAPDFPAPDSWIHGRHYAGSGVWVNSPPLNFEKLKRKTVLIDFWEYTCINCIRTFDILKKWDARYRPLGLAIIGVHAPEFDFAYDPDNVRRAARRFGLKFPIVVDSDFRIWRSYGNNSWPSKFLIGPDRRILFAHVGEGEYGAFERQIREALKAANPKVKFPPGEIVEPDKDLRGRACGDATGEVYAGTARGGASKLPRAGVPEDGAAFIEGAWRAEPDAQRAEKAIDKDTFLGVRYRGAEIYAVLNTVSGPMRVDVEQDGRPLDQAHAQIDVRFDEKGQSYVEVSEPRLYYLARNPDDQPHEIRLIPLKPGLGVYSFTFGNRCQADFSHL